MRIDGAKVFVTGANRGLGLAFARQAVRQGAAKVYAGMRSVNGFEEDGLTPVQIDVTDPDSISRAISVANDATVLINNAGVGALVKGALDPAIEERSRTAFEVNFFGLIRVTQAFSPILAQNRESAILNVLSVASWAPIPALTPYSASKAAAWNYTNHLRLALQAQNTSVVALHVGFVDTDLTRGLPVPKNAPEEVAKLGFAAIEADEREALIDDAARRIKAGLSDFSASYLIDFKP